MRKVLHRLAAIAAVSLMTLYAGAGSAETPVGLENFPVRYGDRENKKIDCRSMKRYDHLSTEKYASQMKKEKGENIC